MDPNPIWLVSLLKGEIWTPCTLRENAMWRWKRRPGWCFYKPRNGKDCQKTTGNHGRDVEGIPPHSPHPWFLIPSQHNRRRQWQPTPVLLPGESHGWRSMVGWRSWGSWAKNSQIYGFSSTHVRIREGNGNPLQYSCLENPMDGGAW